MSTPRTPTQSAKRSRRSSTVVLQGMFPTYNRALAFAPFAPSPSMMIRSFVRSFVRSFARSIRRHTRPRALDSPAAAARNRRAAVVVVVVVARGRERHSARVSVVSCLCRRGFSTSSRASSVRRSRLVDGPAVPTTTHARVVLCYLDTLKCMLNTKNMSDKKLLRRKI